jgi:ribonucleoside-diphosphate reductase alpha chain
MKIANAVFAPLLNPNAIYILRKRYLEKDTRGRVSESPTEMMRSVARVVSQAELIYNKSADTVAWENSFFNIIARLEFLPNSPTLLNAGRLSGQLASCFMLPVEDSLEPPSASVEEATLVHLSGGGTGFNLSNIPAENGQFVKGDKNNRGPLALLASLSASTAAVKQGGIRRGCNIAMLDVHHPDIMAFIHAKNNSVLLPNFYLAVGVTDEFIQALKNGTDYDLFNPRTSEITGRQNAAEVFKHIVDQTWKTGDPGVIFLNRIQQDNPVPNLGKIAGVSGCGEQMLFPYESCNLGSINLARMLKGKDKSTIDYAKVGKAVKLAVRFLDNIIDINRFPLPQIEVATKKARKIGLGVMGFADMLIQMGVPYDSEEALKIAEEVMGFVNDTAHEASAELGRKRGVFPAFEGSIYVKPGGTSMRNASCTTIAPTGTISLIAGCSNGIEPLFALIYARRIMEGKTLLEINPYFITTARQLGFYSDGLMKKLARGISLNAIEDVPQSVKRLFVTAPEIAPEWHVRMQAAFQRHTDNAVSKTVNLPYKATRKDVADIYLLAYEQGLKGITIYRDGSRRKQPLDSRVDAKLIARHLKQT